MSSKRLCDCCGKDTFSHALGLGHRWYLTQYFGITGCFCNKCYTSKIAHDALGNPKHPRAFKKLTASMYAAQALTQANNK